MKDLLLGSGFDPITNEKAASVFDGEVQYTTVETQSYSSTSKLIEGGSQTRDEIAASVKFSVNVHNVDPQVQGGFSNELKINTFDTYYLLNFTKESHRTILNTDKTTISANTKKLIATNNIAAIKNRHGGRFVESIIYGQKLTAIIQFTEDDASQTTKTDFKTEIKAPYVDLGADMSTIFEKIRKKKIANIYYYVSGTNQPNLELINNINDLRNLLTTLGPQPEEKTEKEKLAEEKKQEKLLLAQQKANHNTVEDLIKFLKAVEDFKKLEEKNAAKKSETAPDKSTETVIKTLLEKATPKEASLEESKPKETKSADPIPPKTTTVKEQKTEANYKAVPIDYTTQPYIRLFDAPVIATLNEYITIADKLLRKISQCTTRAIAYKNSVDYALKHESCLQFNIPRRAELDKASTSITQYIDSFKDLSSQITNNIFLTEDKIKVICDQVNKIINDLNKLNTSVVKFKDSAFLVGIVHTTLKPKHASNNFSLDLPPQTEDLYFEFNDKSQPSARGQIENINLKIKKHVFFRKNPSLVTKIQSGGSGKLLLKGNTAKTYSNLYLSSIERDGAKIKNKTSAIFDVEIYAKTGTTHDPLTTISPTSFTIQAPSFFKPTIDNLLDDFSYGKYKNEKIYFLKIDYDSVDAKNRPGSCCPLSLRTTRDDMHKVLNDNLGNNEVVNMIIKQIKNDFQFDKEILTSYLTASNYQTLEKLFDDYNNTQPKKELPSSQDGQDQAALQTHQAATTALDNFLKSSELIKDYLDQCVLKEWIGCYVAYAWAIASKVNLRIWGPVNTTDPLKMQLISPGVESDPKKDFIDIFYNGVDHFYKLELVPAPTPQAGNTADQLKFQYKL